ncbi:zinc-finger protein 80-like protein, partial [Aphelenchoides avenae]
RRIVDAVRGSRCRHIECFDLRTYLEYHRVLAFWECPFAFCREEVNRDQLRIDEYTTGILRNTPERIREIEVHADGSYKVADQPEPDVVKITNDEEPFASNATWDEAVKMEEVEIEETNSGSQMNCPSVSSSKRRKTQSEMPAICPQCRKTFAHVYVMRRHVETIHEGKRDFKCPQCPYAAQAKLDLEMHVWLQHEKKTVPPPASGAVQKAGTGRQTKRGSESSENNDDESEPSADMGGTWKCSKCDFRTPMKRKLTYHFAAVHNTSKHVKCEQCGITCINNYILKKHISSVHEKERPFACPQCPHRAAVASNLKRHIESVHEKAKPFKCEECDYAAKLAGTLKKHVEHVHLGLRPHKCELCGKAFGTSGHLQRHIEAIHLKLKQFHCKLCEYKASTIHAVRQYYGCVHEKQRSYKCEQCDYATVVKKNLLRHVYTIHVRGIPHKCTQCDFATAKPFSLKVHVANVHENRKLFQCKQCEFSANRPAEMRHHTNNKHAKLRPYKCDQCDYAGAFKHRLVMHKNAVHGEKNFMCGQCNYRSGAKGELKRHLLNRHTAEKRYQCKHCSYGTYQATILLITSERFIPENATSSAICAITRRQRLRICGSIDNACTNSS